MVTMSDGYCETNKFRGEANMIFDVLKQKIVWLLSLLSAWMLICGLFAVPAFSQTLRLDITEGQIAPIPVAVADFTGLDGVPSNVGRQISQVIADDLVSSGLFTAIDSAAFIAPPTSPSLRPNFSNWTPLGAKGLVVGSALLIVMVCCRLSLLYGMWFRNVESLKVVVQLTRLASDALRTRSQTLFMKNSQVTPPISIPRLFMFLNQVQRLEG